MGEGLEDRHETETAYAQPEDDVALSLRELGDISLGEIVLFVKLAIQLVLQDECWHEHRHKRRNKDFREDTLCRDDTLDPEHDGGDVANR